MKKRLLSFILALVMVAGLIPMSLITVSADATMYDVWVNGQQFDSENMEITCGSGSAKLDVTTTPYTLTLDNAEITGVKNDSGYSYAILAYADLKIVLKGTNTITTPAGDNSAIGCIKNAPTTKYALSIVSTDADDDKLTINHNGNLNGIVCETADFAGTVYVAAGEKRVLSASSGATLGTGYNWHGSDTVVPQNEATGTITAEDGTLKVSGSNAKTLYVHPAERYNVWVSGKEFTSVNAASGITLPALGSAKLDVTTTPYTLTLDTAFILNTANVDGNAQYGLYADGDLKIVLKRDALIDVSAVAKTAGWIQGIYVGGKLTLEGEDSTLTVNANNADGSTVGMFVGALDLGNIKGLYVTAPNYALGSLADLVNPTKYGAVGSVTAGDTYEGLTAKSTFDSDAYKFVVGENVAKTVRITKASQLYLTLYRNGTTNAVVDCKLIDNPPAGYDYDFSVIDYEDYFTNDGKSYVFHGWYNDGGWNSYTSGGNPSPLAVAKPNGWFNVKGVINSLETVKVYAVKDGDKTTATEIGSFQAEYGTNLYDFLNENLTVTVPYHYTWDNTYMNWDWYGHSFDSTKTVGGWTNVYVNLVPDTFPCHVVIYKNFDYTTPWKDIALTDVKQDQVINLADIDINDYFASTYGFVFNGWYNDGQWNVFKANGSAAGLETITVNGWTNIVCNVVEKQMVQVQVYKNGNFTTPCETVALDPVALGDTIDLTALDINDYYTNTRGFDFTAGWFYDGTWNQYKNGGTPAASTELTVNGWTNIIAYVRDAYLLNIPVYVEGENVLYGSVNLTGYWGEDVDYTDADNLAAQFIGEKYPTYGAEYEIKSSSKSYPNKTEKFGEEYTHWTADGKYYLMIDVMPYYALIADIYENGVRVQPYKRITLTGLKGETIDYSKVEDFAKDYLVAAYDEKIEKYFGGIEIAEYRQGDHNYPTEFGVNKKAGQWHGESNVQFWVIAFVDTDFTFVGVLNDNGTKNAAQTKQYGVYGTAIDYTAVQTWAENWAAEKYPDAYENKVEIKSVSNTDSLPATLGDTDFNWWSPDKYYANVNLTTTYTVDYKLDGADFGTDYVTIEEFPTYSVKDSGSKTGYTFSGWYETQEELDAIVKVADIDLSKSVTALDAGNHTLYGKFVANPVKITVFGHWMNAHDPDITIFQKLATDADTIVYDDVIATYLTAQNVSAEVLSKTPAGYSWDQKFYLYNAVPELVEVTDQTAVDTNDIFTLFTPNQYRIIYHGNGGSKTNGAVKTTSTVTFDAPYTIKNANTFARRGYTFLGWSAAADDSTIIYNGSESFNEYKTVGDEEYYAQWEVNVYDITYVLNDDESVSKADNTANPTTYTVEDTVTLTAPERAGYTFLGWYDNAAFEGNAVTSFSDEIGDKTFYAKWEVITYTITYVLSETTASPVTNSNVATYTVEDNVTLAAPSRRGYNFINWHEGDNVNGSVVTGFSAGTTGNKTFFAEWSIITYTITYDLNYDRNTESVPQNNNSNVKTYTVEDNVTFYNPSRRGYTFKKWTENGNKTTGFSAGTIGNKTIVANWEINVYTVTYVLNGGANNSNNVKTYTVEDHPHFIRAGIWPTMSFGGWYTDKNMTAGNYFDCIKRGSVGDITLYAKWMNLSFYLLNQVRAANATVSEPVNTADDVPATVEPVVTETTDVIEAPAASEWAVEEVSQAIEAGLVPEELCDKFTDGITRGELAKIVKTLLDVLGVEAPETIDAQFTDTDDADVLYLASLGIINGYKTNDGFEFKAENTLKRSEITAIINRVGKLCGAEVEGYEDEVKFEDTENHWCKSELGWAVHNEISKGTSDKTYSPENTLTREQAIILINRTFNVLKSVETADAE